MALGEYRCDERWCCDEGFLCPTTKACVTSCADCGSDYVGACGERGVCVTDCTQCSGLDTAGTGLKICDGVCIDTLQDANHCGDCGNVCGDGWSIAECSKGHCCLGGT